ncbi:MAG: D-aminoacyl-tRNA deacylase [Halococcoides sp.]
MIGILASEADPASIAIRDALDSLLAWRQADGYRRSADDQFAMRTVEELHLYLERPDEPFPPLDRLLVVSKHAGETGRLLTAHPPGNVASAAHGGDPATLPPADPRGLDAIQTTLREHAPATYDVGMECTHHGPTAVAVPITFVEIGSDEAAWADDDAARAVARSIAALPEALDEIAEDRAIAGFGGGHYVPRFERIARETEWSVGHVAADWALDDGRVTPAVIERVVTASNARCAVIDGDRPAVRDTLARTDTRVVSETWLRAADGVALDRIDALEDALGSIDAGLLVGDRAATAPDWSIDRAPDALLDIARSIDRETTDRVLAEHCVAVEREDDTPTGRVAVGPAGLPIDSLVAIVERDATVRREDAAIEIEQRVFDPGKAHAMGVPEGPAFGRLADGQSVTVDDERIDPDAVHRIETTRIDLES